MSDPEKQLILEMIGVAQKDALRNFSGTKVFDQAATVASAKRFIGSMNFEVLCEFVGGDPDVIRRRVG